MKRASLAALLNVSGNFVAVKLTVETIVPALLGNSKCKLGD